MSYRIIHADIFDGLQQIEDHSIHCVVTSPPYYGLRTYGIPPRKWDDGSECVFGEEPSLELYIHHAVEVFRGLKRVLHQRGTFWLNIADCYAGGGKHVEPKAIYNIPLDGKPTRKRQKGLTGKDLLMVPARMALALQADGWILRQDNIWAKGVSFLKSFSGTVMPESTRDRTTWAHEHVYQLVLRTDYFYDQDGCREAFAQSTRKEAQETYTGQGRKDYAAARAQNPSDVKRRVVESVRRNQQTGGGGRNLRNVWVIGKQNFKGAHFATFPEKLVRPIIQLATSEKGCCPHCGEPVRRKTIREPVPADVQAAFNAARVTSAETSGRTDGHTRRKPNYRRRVLRTEWEVGCECPGFTVEAAVPCRVCDPFVGSGRAGIVAVGLGRDFTGIDASADYCRMASNAIERACGATGRRIGADAPCVGASNDDRACVSAPVSGLGASNTTT